MCFGKVLTSFSVFSQMFFVQMAILKAQGKKKKRFGELDAGFISQIVAPFEIRLTPGFREMTGALYSFSIPVLFKSLDVG